MKTNLISRLGILLAIFFGACAPHPTFMGDANRVQVTRVVDGDTFVARDADGNEIRVRLIGIDAPESRRTRNTEVEFFAMESKAFLVSLIDGQQVILQYDVEKYDRFDRILAYVYLDDGTFVNAELVGGGYAQVATFPPNVKHVDKFVSLQRRARRENRGLWQ